MDEFSFIGNSNIDSIEHLYQQYQQNPDDVPLDWKHFFKGFEFARKNYPMDGLHPDIFDKEYQGESADVVALIYAHFPKELRKVAHQKAVQWLKPGGRIILEAFNTEQINNSSGGPKNIEMLYTKEMLAEDFKELHLVKLETIKTNLSEGDYHRGQADVVRLIAIK